MNLHHLKCEAAKLSQEDQVSLHRFLGDFVDLGQSVEEEWDQEISRRIEEGASGPTSDALPTTSFLR